VDTERPATAERTGQSAEAAPEPQPAVELPTGTLLVADKQSAKLHIVALPERTSVATLPTGDGPHEIAVSEDGALAIVTNYGGFTAGNSLTVVDLEAATVTRTVDLGEHQRPHGARFRPASHEVVVTSEVSRSVLVVDAADGTILSTVGTEQDASHMLVLSPDGRRAYTANVVAGTVSEVDLEQGKHVRTIAVAPMSEAIAISPDGNQLWVGSNAEHSISVVDLGVGKVVDTLDAPGVPIRVELDREGQRAVVTAAEAGAVYLFDVQTRERVGTVELEHSPVPVGVALARDLAFVSLARTGQVAVIDLSAAAVLLRIDAGLGPDGIAFVRG